MKWKEFVVDYLTFTRKDRIAILALLGLILVIFLLPSFFQNSGFSKPTAEDSAWIESVKDMIIKDSSNQNVYEKNDDNYGYQYDRPKSYDSEKETVELFFFDPNSISTDGWKKLGLKEKTIKTIQNYLSKGGVFTKPEDLKKIYGLHTNDYERLEPYIKIEGRSSNETSKSQKTIAPVNPNSSSYSVIDINEADSTAFISLPGIGNKLAARIINFRDKLGGFYSITQVGETYGLPDSTFQKIKQYLKLGANSVKKININTATVDELKAHPYIKWSIANPIVAYRNEHGPFSKPEDIKKVMAVTDEVYNKIAPYLSIQ
ncbi:MAG: helix-hairpin-helix domain-containing protein [Chitinophagaceae bacterium]